ncbi:MAG: YndJ family transporter [Verrucomicrobiota bacterium]
MRASLIAPWQRWKKATLSASALLLLLIGSGLGHNPWQPSWISWMLLISIGLLLPLGEPLAMRPGARGRPHLAFVGLGFLLLLWQALVRPPGLETALLASVWLAYRLGIATEVLWLAMQTRRFSLAQICLDGARLFPAIGAAWLVANRANWMPWGFDALIVLLTAAHFHHAGYTLPLMAGLCGQALPGRASRVSCGLILAGVPLVAIGITCTHFKVLPWIEPLAVSILVAGALGVALLQMQMAFQKGLSAWARALFLISGLSLLVAMLLALTFGLRSLFPAWALPMPTMWAIHGTLNTFGFGLCGVLAWRSRGHSAHTA